MNPRVTFPVTVTSLDLSNLSAAIKQTTGLNYGFHPEEMIDTQILSATLTLCGNGKRMFSHRKMELVTATIVAWGIGRGMWVIGVKW